MKNAPPTVEPLLQSSLRGNIGIRSFFHRRTPLTPLWLTITEGLLKFICLCKCPLPVWYSNSIEEISSQDIDGVPIHKRQWATYWFRRKGSVCSSSHITSSSHYPQSNGFAERSEKTIKNMIELLLIHTSLWWTINSITLVHGLSPEELLMGQRIRMDVPQVKTNLIPSKLKENKKFKDKQKRCYDQHHWLRPTLTFSDNSSVWLNTQGRQVPARITETPLWSS